MQEREKILAMILFTFLIGTADVLMQRARRRNERHTAHIEAVNLRPCNFVPSEAISLKQEAMSLRYTRGEALICVCMRVHVRVCVCACLCVSMGWVRTKQSFTEKGITFCLYLFAMLRVCV